MPLKPTVVFFSETKQFLWGLTCYRPLQLLLAVSSAFAGRSRDRLLFGFGEESDGKAERQAGDFEDEQEASSKSTSIYILYIYRH